jgi:hypothetical protein
MPAIMAAMAAAMGGQFVGAGHGHPLPVIGDHPLGDLHRLLGCGHVSAIHDDLHLRWTVGRIAQLGLKVGRDDPSRQCPPAIYLSRDLIQCVHKIGLKGLCVGHGRDQTPASGAAIQVQYSRWQVLNTLGGGPGDHQQLAQRPKQHKHNHQPVAPELDQFFDDHIPDPV